MQILLSSSSSMAFLKRRSQSEAFMLNSNEIDNPESLLVGAPRSIPPLADKGHKLTVCR
jgi:hypothetical protein